MPTTQILDIKSLKSPWCEKSERESVNQKCNQFQSANSGNENEIISRHLIKIDRLSWLSWSCKAAIKMRLNVIKISHVKMKISM